MLDFIVLPGTESYVLSNWDVLLTHTSVCFKLPLSSHCTLLIFLVYTEIQYAVIIPAWLFDVLIIE